MYRRDTPRCGFLTAPYHAFVPSFGEWGFILASPRTLTEEWRLPGGLRFIDAKSIPGLSQFPPDMARVAVQVNRLNNQALVRYFDAEWARYSQQ